MNQEKIGKFIQEMRKQKKMTQQELAEKLGVSDKSVSRWENGNNLPDASLYNLLCDELNISINELLSGQRLEEKDYQRKLEENIVLLNDNNKKRISKIQNRMLILIGIIFAVVIILLSVGIIYLKITDYYDNRKIYFPVKDVHYEICKFKPNTDESQIIIKSAVNNKEKSIVTAKRVNDNIVIQNFKYERWNRHPEEALSHNRITPTGKFNKIYYNDTLIWDGKEELKECVESKGLTLTYEVVAKEKEKLNNNIDYYYITVKKYDSEELDKVLLSNNLVENVEIGKTYEFTFYYTMNTFIKGEKTTHNIFKTLELLSVKETNKTGLDQINDEIF